MRLAIASDTHFLHCADITKSVRKFVQQLEKLSADALILAGDISDNKDWTKRLSHIRQTWGKDTYFVLGNHDYYDWSWAYGNAVAQAMSDKDERLFWLDGTLPSGSGYLELDGMTALVGSSSPACLTVGVGPLKSGLWEDISDFKRIKDLSHRIGNPSEMIAAQTQLAMSCANELRVRADAAMHEGYNRLVIVTHVAPYEWSAMWRGYPTDEKLKPFYISQYLGDVIDNIGSANTDVEIVCIHGHTHGAFRGRHPELDNIMVLAGKAEYKLPAIQMVLDTLLPFCGAHTA